MILSREYLRRLIRARKADHANITAYKSRVVHKGKIYIAVDRYDIQRVDHYEPIESDFIDKESADND